MMSSRWLCGLLAALLFCSTSTMAFVAGTGRRGWASGVSISTPESSSSSALAMVRHGRRVDLLAKPADQRKALMRALTTQVIRHGRIKTTLVRAKAVRKHVDHMIELGKRGDLHARRQALAWMYDKALVASLFEAAAERYADQQGGYTRVLRTVARQGDNSPMAILELV